MWEDEITATGIYPNAFTECHEAWFVDDENQYKLLVATCRMDVSRQEYDWWVHQIADSLLDDWRQTIAA